MKNKRMITSSHKGQTKYYLEDDMHKVKKVWLNGRRVKVEFYFELPSVPRKYGEIELELTTKNNVRQSK